jgi:hypothetical protein
MPGLSPAARLGARYPPLEPDDFKWDHEVIPFEI